MRFDPAKAFPYPVLRPESSDYVRQDFEVELQVERIEGSTELRLAATFETRDPDLLRFVNQGRARYAVLIKCAETHYRRLFERPATELTEIIPAGRLAGAVEILPFLVVTREIFGHRGKNWHDEFGGRRFNFRPGQVLAADRPWKCWVDTLDEAPIGSMFQIATAESARDGAWTLSLDSDRIQIIVSRRDLKLLNEARGRAKGSEDWSPLMNGLYLPALIEVLERTHRTDCSPYEDLRWYDSLNGRLDQIGAPRLGAATNSSSEWAKHAQQLLGRPFATLLQRLTSESEGSS